MRPTSTKTTISRPFWNWNSPLPYLFGGLSLTLLLITVALIILACSYRKRPSNSNDDSEEKPPMHEHEIKTADIGPKFAVIMAGEENPTHVAIPIPNSLPSSVQQA
ncbi:Protein GLUTAMINE DUMPER 2 [Abeliophyllum distichum]|uniref:Protein GLUTAMINE DUMPER 2 n=1 Tax=Abeliophyllum distichum TaxID=126358 RepID=A0ABD1SGM2_9LAMI